MTGLSTREYRNRAFLAGGGLLLAAVVFVLVNEWSEILDPPPYLNDNVLHLGLTRSAARALDQGQDPTDFWFTPVTEGYPLFRHYQHLPHVVMASIHRILGGALPVDVLFRWSTLLLLALFPLSVAWSVWWIGLGRLAGVFSGLAAAFLSSQNLYGLDLSSYGWGGSGMTTQLWGMVFLGPTWAATCRAVRDGRRVVLAAALMAGLLLTHTVMGYVAVLSTVVILFAGGRDGIRVRGLRLALLLLLAAAAVSYFLVPFFLDRDAMNRSVWEDRDKYDAYGAALTLERLVKGELFDYPMFSSRSPVLTLLLGIGILVSLFRFRRRVESRLLLLLFAFWLLLYFGRPTWGVILQALPMSSDLHFHRLIAPVHLAGAGLAGVGLAWIWKVLLREKAHLLPLAGLVVLTVAAFLPALQERISFFDTRCEWLENNRTAFAEDRGQLDRLLESVAARPPGRVCARLPAAQGDEYKIGDVPVHARVTSKGLDSVGYLYHALSLNADIQGYMDESRPAHLNLFNVRYVIAPADRKLPALGLPVETHGRHRLYIVETTGYFDVVDVPQVFTGTREEWFPAARDWLHSPLVEAKIHPALIVGPETSGSLPMKEIRTHLDAMAAGGIPSSPGMVAEAEIPGDGHFIVDVHASRDCTLMLKATYHPRWRAEVDGRAVAPVMVAPAFTGVPLSAGDHRVVLKYEPGPLRTILFWAGLAVLLLAAVLERFGLVSRLDGMARRLPVLPASALTRLGTVGFLLGVAMLAGLPLFQFRLMDGHDTFEYLPRAVEFHRCLADGILLPRWAPDLGGGYGYPFFLFNPPLYYYTASLFSALGFDFIPAQNLACLLLLLLAGVGMYLFVSCLSTRLPGMVAAAAYLFAPYVLTNLYVRHALAEFTIFAVAPFALYALLNTILGRGYRYLFLASLCVGLVNLTHNPAALITLPALALYVLVIALGLRSWRGFWMGGLSLLAGLGLSAFLWLPALLEKPFIKVGELLHGYLHYANHFVYLRQLIHSPWGYGISEKGLGDGMSFSLGPVHLGMGMVGLLLLSAVLLRKRQGASSTLLNIHLVYCLVLLAVCVFLVTPLSRPLWDRVQLLQYMEFPWRFLVLAALATPFLVAYGIACAPPRSRVRLAVAVMVALLAYHLPCARPDRFHDVNEAEYTPQKIAEKNLAVTTRREYEPVWVKEPPPLPVPGRLVLCTGEVTLVEEMVTSCSSTLVIEAAVPSRVMATTFYFPGWTVHVDGEERPAVPENASGLLEFDLERGRHVVSMRFGTTAVRRWGGIVSAAVLFVLIGYGVFARLRKKKKTAQDAE